MGGQACVLYGSSEFSRDIDLAILVEPENLDALRRALAELQADVIALPMFESRHLEAGHAVHFRCRAPAAAGVRIDLMGRMRGVAPFSELWGRRKTDAAGFPLLSLPDLVAAKKTQRDKDWPMIRRLVEADYFLNRDAASEPSVLFWLAELRTPELLAEVVHRHPALSAGHPRAAVQASVAGASALEIERAMEDEEAQIRASDREYWLPLRRELERMRRERNS